MGSFASTWRTARFSRQFIHGSSTKSDIATLQRPVDSIKPQCNKCLSCATRLAEVTQSKTGQEFLSPKKRLTRSAELGFTYRRATRIRVPYPSLRK